MNKSAVVNRYLNGQDFCYSVVQQAAANNLCLKFGLNNIYFEKLSHTNLQTEQSGFGRKLQACKDHLPKKDHLLN